MSRFNLTSCHSCGNPLPLHSAETLAECRRRSDAAAEYLAAQRPPTPPASAGITLADGRRVSFTTLAGAISTLREAWRDDGAEGESVHLVCDAVERLTAHLDAAREVIDRGTEKLALQEQRATAWQEHAASLDALANALLAGGHIVDELLAAKVTRDAAHAVEQGIRAAAAAQVTGGPR